MAVGMTGRRIPVVLDAMTWPTEPGDYVGPVKGWTGDLPAVFFLKPNARDEGAPPSARGVQYIVSPPHTFTEEADGTLTIGPSISDMRRDSTVSDGWHGFLEHGVWRQV